MDHNVGGGANGKSRSQEAMEYIREVVNRLEVGQRIQIGRFFIMDIGENIFTGETPLDRILSGIAGSSWNLRTTTDQKTGDVIFEKMAEGNTRWNVDRDRRHMFDENEDGSLDLKARYALSRTEQHYKEDTFNADNDQERG